MLHQFDPRSVSEARQRAVLVEQQNRLSNNQWAGNTKARNTTSSTEESKASMGCDTTTGPRANPRSTEPATDAVKPRPSRPNALRCFTCGERGHIQTTCPNKGRRGLLANDRDIAGDPIYDTEDDGQFEDIEEEQVNGDT